MLTLIRGNFRSGKTTRILSLLHQDLDSQKEPLLLVPTRYEKDRLSGRIADERKKGYAGSIIRTLSDTVQTIIDSSGQRIHTISNFESFILMKTIIEDNRKNFKYYHHLDAGSGLVRLIYSAVNEIRAGHVLKGEDWQNTVRSQDQSGKWEDVLAIHALYEEQLKIWDLYDSYRLLNKASEILENRTPFYSCALYLDGFFDFTESQFQFIRALILHFEKSNLPVFMTLPNLPIESIRETENKLTENFTLTTENMTHTNVLSGFSRAFLSGNIEPGCETPDLEVIPAFGKYREAERIANRIQQMVLQDNYSYNDIGIILRSPEASIRPIRSIFKELKIPFFTSRDEALKENPAILFFHHILSIAMRDETLDTISLIELTASGYVGNPEIKLLSGITSVLPAFIRGNSKTWLQALENRIEYYHEKRNDAFNSDESGKDTEEYTRLLKKAKDFQKPLVKILDLLFSLNDSFTVSDFLRWFSKIIEELNIKESLSENGEELAGRDFVAFRKLKDTLNSLKKVTVLSGKESFNRKSFYTLFNTLISDVSYRYEPYLSDAVQILTPFDARGCGYKAVFIAGLNEGEFPGNAVSSLFEHTDKRKVNELARKVVFEDEDRRSAMEKLDFSLSLSRSSGKIILTHTPFNESGQEILQSPFLTRVLELAQMEHLSKADNSLFEIVPSERWMELFDLRLLIKGDFDLLNPEQRKKLKKYFSQIEESEKMLNYFRAKEQINAIYESDLQIPQDNHSSFNERYFGKLGLSDEGADDKNNQEFLEKKLNKMTFSSSRLETMGNCRHAFFFRYLLDIYEENYPTQSIERALKGDFYHAVLKTWADETAALSGEEISADFSAKENLLNKILESTYKEFIQNEPAPGLFALEKEFYRKVLTGFIRFDAEELRKESKPSETEKPIQKEISIGKDKMQITGKVDRVDKTESGVSKITDYKSGNVDHFSKDLKIPLKVFQGYLYAEALESKVDQIRYVSIEKQKSVDALPLKKNKSETIIDFNEIWQVKEKELSLLLRYYRDGNFSPFNRKSELPEDILSFYHPEDDSALQTESDNKCRYCCYQKACLRLIKRQSDWF